MVDLSEFDNPWFSLLYRARTGKVVEKSDIVKLLRSDAPVIDEAKSFIAEALEGKRKFKRGTKQRREFESFILRDHISGMVDMLAEEKGKTAEKLKGQTPRDTAKATIAKSLGVSIRTLESIIGSARRKVKK